MRKKYSLLLIISMISVTVIFTSKIVNADSGWDFDYDSGSSLDSGSSWYSSSSWDSDSSWSSSNSGVYTSGTLGSTDPSLIIFTIIIIVIIIALASKLGHNMKNSVPSAMKKNYQELTDEQIKIKDASINPKILKETAFNLYKEIQIAWMNFDNDTLRKNTTDEMYNMYTSQLKTLQLKKQQNIMKEIALKTCKIISLEIENGKEEVKLYLNVSQYDYVVDKDQKVVRGTDKYKNNVEYIITLIRNMENKKIEKCPNCGATIDIVSGGVCPYCDSTIINNNQEFIMSKKECVGQCKE